MFNREVFGRLEMHWETVPDDHCPMAESMMERPQEGNQNRCVDVRTVQLEGEVHPPADRRDRQRADRRDPIVLRGFEKNGRAARRCPGPANGRLEHEARFVQENYRLTPTGRPFFIRGHSTFRQRSSASGSCCRARRWGFCSVRSSCRRIFST